MNQLSEFKWEDGLRSGLVIGKKKEMEMSYYGNDYDSHSKYATDSLRKNYVLS